MSNPSSTRGGGNILVTSATSTMRGNVSQHAHAAAICGGRMLCQTFNAELSVEGINICHIYIDAPSEASDTTGRLLGDDPYAKLLEEKDNGKDCIVIPEKFRDLLPHRATAPIGMDQ